MGVPSVIRGGKSEEQPPDRAPQQEEEKPKPRKSPRHTYNVSDDVHQQAVNAVDFLSGPPHRERLGKLVERAIAAEVKRLETMHNDGNPFPEAAGPLRTGKRPGG